MPLFETEAVVTVLYEEKDPIEIYIDRQDRGIRSGDIYVGHVERVAENSGGVFVKITPKETGFLPFNRLSDAVYAAPKKDDQIKAGDELLVQVETESHEDKQAVLNCRLKIPENRTLLEEIREKGIHRPYGTCLYRFPDPWKYLLKKYGAKSFSRIVTDIPEVYEDLGGSADLYEDPMLRLYKLYEFGALLDKLNSRYVWLKNGGSLIIEQTAAFVCIDVNSAKASGKKEREDHLLSVNLEAAEEAFGQIRLRQLSGTILIDFITMKDEEHKQALMERCRELAAEDPVFTDVIDLTALGILEVTRHKVKRSLKAQIAALKEQAQKEEKNR